RFYCAPLKQKGGDQTLHPNNNKKYSPDDSDVSPAHNHFEAGFRRSALNSITMPRSGASPTFFTVWITGGLKSARAGVTSTKMSGAPSGHCWRRVRLSCITTRWLWLCLGRVSPTSNLSSKIKNHSPS